RDDGQAGPPVADRLDRGMGRARHAQPVADAAAGPAVRTGRAPVHARAFARALGLARRSDHRARRPCASRARRRVRDRRGVDRDDPADVRRDVRRAARASFATLAAALAVATLAACSGSSSRSTATRPTAATPRAVARQAVGVVTATYVDTSRPTPKSGPDPAQPRRTLVTTILYPATGPAGSTTPVRDAPPARRDGPFPLIVFAHGLGASPQVYEPGLLDQWVAAGYVVAAPQFPLTSSATPNGVDAADVVNQPGDVSFVITSILRASATRRGPLAGLVDPDRIGAAGHSNGAITTLGLVANTCCRDPRVKAAAVLAGDTVAFPNGRYDFVHAPPLLFVHGTDDALLPYAGIVSAFDEARGPKGLLTIEHGDHSSAAAGQRASSADVVRTTEDFFDAYLRDDGPARTRLARDGEPGVTTLDFVTTRGATATIPTIPEPPTQRRATVEPSRNLR